MSAPATLMSQQTKDYGGGRGLFQLNLQVERQNIFGFLGPNGAGKTTTIRLLKDMLRPAGGTASLLGRDGQRDSVAIKRKVAYVAGEPSARGGCVRKPRRRLHNDAHGEAGPT
jgi:ABC-2 type transport system ATP-binding protein